MTSLHGNFHLIWDAPMTSFKKIVVIFKFIGLRSETVVAPDITCKGETFFFHPQKFPKVSFLGAIKVCTACSITLAREWPIL